MLSFPIVLISWMDSLKYLFEKPTLTSRISRWTLMLDEFDLKSFTAKSVKGRVVAEQLANYAINSKEEGEFLFSDEEVMKIQEGL